MDNSGRRSDHRPVTDKKPLSAQLKESWAGRAVGKRAVAFLNERELQQPPAPHAASGWALQHLRLLESLPRDKLDALLESGVVQDHPRRQRLVLTDDASRVWLVLEGGVKLGRVTSFGRRLIEALLGPGDVFGRVASGGELIAYEVETLERTRLLVVERRRFALTLRECPELAYSVVQDLEQRQRKLVRRLEALAFKDVSSRVAETLLELAREHAEPCSHGFAVDVRITQQDLADLVGASRQMVNRVLGELSRKLYLHRAGRVICILHRERLQRLAESWQEA